MSSQYSYGAVLPDADKQPFRDEGLASCVAWRKEGQRDNRANHNAIGAVLRGGLESLNRCRTAVLLLLLWLAVSGIAVAQTASEEIDPAPTRWTAMLDGIDDELNAKEIEEPAFDHYQRVLEALIDDAERQKVRAVDTLAGPKSELDALGPAPKEGDRAEADSIAKQRSDIIEQVAMLEARRKQADLIVARAETLLDRLGSARGDRLQRQLFTRGPSLFSAVLWHAVLDDAGRVVSGVVDDAQHILQAQRRSAVSDWPVLILVFVLTLAALPLRRWLLRRYGRGPTSGKPSYAQRTWSAFAEGVARGLLPAAMIGGIGFTLISQELIAEQGFALVSALTISAVLAIAAAAPIAAALAPDWPNWRLLPVESDAARDLGRRLRWLIVACAIMLSLYLATEPYRPYGVELRSVSNLLLSGIVGLLLLSLFDRRLWRSGAEAPLAIMQSPGHRLPWMLSALRRLLKVVLVFAVVLAMVGYVGLGGFIVSRVAISAVFIGGLLLVRRLLHELTEQLLGLWRDRVQLADATTADDSTPRFWLHSVLDLLLALPALVVLAGFWGVPQAVLYLWSRRLLDGVAVGDLTLSPGRILLALLVFFTVFVVTRVLRRVVYDRVLPYTRFDFGLRHSIYTGIGYLGLTLASVLAIIALGVSPGNLALIVGALSVGIGLGLQGVVNNFVSGLVLLLQRPIKVGDWIEVGSHEGVVKDIMAVSTEIETFDKASIIIPNGDVVSKSIINWTHTDSTVRVIIAVGVAYGSDTDRVQALLLACAAEEEDVLSAPEPYALFVDFGDSALEFELRVFVLDADRYFIVASQLRLAIDRAFRDAGIVIPFPQREVLIKDPGPVSPMPESDAARERNAPRRDPPPQPREADDGAD